MAKKKTIEILNEIADYIRINKNVNVHEIAKKIKSNWDTVSKYLTFLEGLGVVTKEKNNYVIKDGRTIKLDDDTIANIPLSPEKKDLMRYVGKLISDAWIKLTGHKPPVTWVHKAEVEVAKKFPQLNIPIGWYFFGQVVLYKFKESELDTYTGEIPESVNDIENFEESVTSIVDELRKKDYFDLLHYQYEKYKKKEYLTKLEMQKIFEKGDIYESREELSSLYYQLVFNYDLNTENEVSKEILDYLKDIVSISVSLIHRNQTKDNAFLKTQLWDVFSCYWELYCTYNLYITLEGDLGYNKEVLKPLFKEKVECYFSACHEKIELVKAFMAFQAG